MIQATFQTRRTVEVCFDLESRPSAFWFDGHTTAEITAFGWKRHGRPVETMTLTAGGRFATDNGGTIAARVAYMRFRDVLAGSDLVYGHNIRAFDLPLFQAGLLRLGLPVLPELRTTDTLKDYPKRKDMSASLENLAKLYDLGGDKKHMSVADWEKSNRLHPAGVAEARERVASDVLLQERLRVRLGELGLLKPPRWWRP